MPALARVDGSLWVFLLYDIAEEIDLQQLCRILGVPPPQREPTFRHPTPDYVRFERPPVVAPVQPFTLSTGEELRGRIKYFDYGVVSLELELPFSLPWDDLVTFSARWISAPEIEQKGAQIVDGHVGYALDALRKSYDRRLDEDYYVIHLREINGDGGEPPTAVQLLAEHGAVLTQIARGEQQRLAPGEQRDLAASSLSYYETDLLMVSWAAALIYDTWPSAAATLQLLEYANSQLLEFRHYDEVLTRVLADVYQSLDRKRRVWHRWRQSREAEHLNTLRLDVTELTERTDNAIKFLSDMYYARAYRLAAQRIGVDDYRRLVDEKLRTAAELYATMVEDFRQQRAFVLEFLVVVILVIELVVLFRGK